VGLRDALDPLPRDYVRIVGARGALVVRGDYRSALLAAGLGPDGDGRVSTGDLAGRKPLGELVLGSERLVVRNFHHGGILRWLNGTRFGDPARPFDELRLAALLAERGLATPTVIAARARRAPVFGWRLTLITRRVEGAIDSSHALEELRERAEPGPVAWRLFETLGAFVGECHRIGFRHTDLTPRNMLVERSVLAGQSARVWILDLDRCDLVDGLDDDARRRVLGRLWRYVSRRDPRPRSGERPVLSRTRVVRFLRAYRIALSGTSAGWREDWRAVERVERRGSLLHRLGWRLEALFGAGPETRDGRTVRSPRRSP